MQRRRYLLVAWCTRTFTATCLATVLACGGASPAAKTPASADSSSGTSAESAERVPLSKAEEQWIVELTRKLNSDNQPEASEVNEAAKRISGAPGILVPICGNVLGPLLDEESDFDLMSKLLVASAAALLETPEVSADLQTMTTSALAAVAQAYRVQRAKTGIKTGPLEALETQERNGKLETWVRKIWGTCPASIALARVYIDNNSENSVFVAPDAAASAGERPWGEAVPNTAQEAKVLDIVKSISVGSADVAIVSEIFTVGPGLYQALLEADLKAKRNDIASIGTPSVTVVPFGDTVTKMPMRTYLAQSDRQALLDSLSFRALSNALSTGRSRPATEAERELWYALIPFEIKGKPVTIIELQGHVFVVFIKEGKIDWIDVLSEYNS